MENHQSSDSIQSKKDSKTRRYCLEEDYGDCRLALDLFERVFCCNHSNSGGKNASDQSDVTDTDDTMLVEDDEQPLLGAIARPSYDPESVEGNDAFGYLFHICGVSSPNMAPDSSSNKRNCSSSSRKNEEQIDSNDIGRIRVNSSKGNDVVLPSRARSMKRDFTLDALSVVSEEPSQVSRYTNFRRKVLG